MRRAFLLGHNISYSLSPVIMRAAFRIMGLRATYELLEIAPDRLTSAISALKGQDVLGLNVTIPHKVSVCSLCDDLDSSAVLAGAANCLVTEGGRLTGHNTDGWGFLMSLEEAGFVPANKFAIILGSGGAARGVAAALSLAGCRAAVVARNPERFAPTADNLCSQGVLVQLEPWERLQGLLPQADLLVNCTPLGTVGEYENQIPCELDEVPVSCVVADLVYRPMKTSWISQAFARGNPTIGGQRMLLWQAVKSIELWTGESAPVQGMWEELQSALCK